jgi:hypothetical protein
MEVMSSIKDGTQTGHGSKDMSVWGPILSTVSDDSPAVVDQGVANLVISPVAAGKTDHC